MIYVQPLALQGQCVAEPLQACSEETVCHSTLKLLLFSQQGPAGG
jgi:hypothetical protein